MEGFFLIQLTDFWMMLFTKHNYVKCLIYIIAPLNE